MSELTGDQGFSIGIIGGGRGGLGLLKFFGNNKVTKVIFVADGNDGALGMAEARANGIPTFSDAEAALRDKLPDFLFDTTGDEALETRIKERLRGTPTRLITPITSRMIVDVLSLNAETVRQDISGIVETIQGDLSRSLATSTSVVSRINSIMSNMQMLALNASIEAAKAGVHGRGFSVVAEHLGKSVDAVRNLTQEINQVNQNIIQVSERSSTVLEKLK
ncbi:MAG: methyl-accepting chemotaxis protein [Holophaga sp.]|nr:methyl-accepting chemotaxis protein [Holophaga sp.]